MYKVVKRDCPMFGIGPYLCEFICDTASDISTLPTFSSEGTGGRTAYDNQKCASGSMAIVADNGSWSKQYMLNNQDIWCPYSVAAGSSEHQDLSEYAKKTDVPGIKVNSAVNADMVNGHTVNADVPADAKFTDTVPDLSLYALKSKYGDTTINVGRKADTTVGEYSTAEGYNTTASGIVSHAEGQSTTASEDCAHAEGWNTTASGKWSHAEGQGTTASGICSHAEGQDTAASGNCSHAEGYETTASGIGSHASGISTQALHRNEAAYGTFNESNDDTLFSVGDGTADDARHNAFEITASGGKLHDKDILTSAHCIQFIPYNMKYYAQNDRILLFSNDDSDARGIYFVNNTPNDIEVCALISASAEGPVVQYGYGSNTYPDIQNTGDGREWFTGVAIPTTPTIYAMTVPSGKLGYYGVYQNSESAYTTIHDIRCPHFNYF